MKFTAIALLAMEALVPTKATYYVACEEIDQWDAGWGDCSTYKKTEKNHEFCQDELHRNNYLPVQVCEECGYCLVGFMPMVISGACDSDNFSINGVYNPMGVTASGAFWYQKTGGLSLYFDESCNGGSAEPRWILDNDQPDEAATSDLDLDGGCSYWGKVIVGVEDITVPQSETWRLCCPSEGGWTDKVLTIQPWEEPPRPAPTPQPLTPEPPRPAPTPLPETPRPTPGPTPTPALRA